MICNRQGVAASEWLGKDFHYKERPIQCNQPRPLSTHSLAANRTVAAVAGAPFARAAASTGLAYCHLTPTAFLDSHSPSNAFLGLACWRTKDCGEAKTGDWQHYSTQRRCATQQPAKRVVEGHTTVIPQKRRSIRAPWPLASEPSVSVENRLGKATSGL